MKWIECLCNNPDVLATLLIQMSFGDAYTIKYQTPVGIFTRFTDALEMTRKWLLTDLEDKTNG